MTFRGPFQPKTFYDSMILKNILQVCRTSFPGNNLAQGCVVLPLPLPHTWWLCLICGGPRAQRPKISPVVRVASANKPGNLVLLRTLSSPWILEERNALAGKHVGSLPRYTSVLLYTPAWKQFAGWRAGKLSLKELCHMLFPPFTFRVVLYSTAFAPVSPSEFKRGLLTWRIWVSRATLVVKFLANLTFWHEGGCYGIVFIIHQKESFQSKCIKYHIT